MKKHLIIDISLITGLIAINILVWLFAQVTIFYKVVLTGLDIVGIGVSIYDIIAITKEARS